MLFCASCFLFSCCRLSVTLSSVFELTLEIQRAFCSLLLFSTEASSDISHSEPLSHDADSCSFLLCCARMKDRRMLIIYTYPTRKAQCPVLARHQVLAQTTLEP